MTLRHRITGREATPAEQEMVERRAKQILSSPYSAPEQVAWALDFAAPEDVEFWFWESCRQRAASKRQTAEAQLGEVGA